MKIALGSSSRHKIRSLKKVLAQLSDLSFDITVIDVESGVSETPRGRRTLEGARSRARGCKESGTADYYVGIESGLVCRYGVIYEEVWCCVLNRAGVEFLGYSSGLKVPDSLLEKMKKLRIPHSLVFAHINNHFDKHINSDTWGQYSGNLISRNVGICEAVRNSFVQVFSSGESLYRKRTI